MPYTYDNWKSNASDPDDRIRTRAEELEPDIAENRAQVLKLDAEQAELFEGEEYEKIFTALADMDFVTLYDIAQVCRTKREVAIREAAFAQATKESEKWPPWQGSSEATAHYVRMRPNTYRDSDV